MWELLKKDLLILIPALACIGVGLTLCWKLTKIYNVTNDNKIEKNTNVVYDITIVKLYSKIIYSLLAIGAILLIIYSAIIVYIIVK